MEGKRNVECFSVGKLENLGEMSKVCGGGRKGGGREGEDFVVMVFEVCYLGGFGFNVGLVKCFFGRFEVWVGL